MNINFSRSVTVSLSFIILTACQNQLRIGGGRSTSAPVQRPAGPMAPRTVQPKIDFDLAESIRTPKSVLILAIGHAEGTIQADGQPTKAYYGHADSGFRNVGVFSCISCGNRSPEEADEYYLENKIKPQRRRFEDSARSSNLPINHPMLSAAFFTLLTQSPQAATDRKGFLERMATLKTQGITLESLIQVSVDSYRDPESNTFTDVARFDNDEGRIRADQKRRLLRVEEFLRKRGIDIYPRY